MADIDPVLQVELLKWREEQRVAAADGRSTAERDSIAGRIIRAHISTDLDDATLTGLGVVVSSRLGKSVIGAVALSDAERLSRTPGVRSVTPGQPLKPDLDGSVEQIRATAVWSGTPGFKGRDVIVGIIDSGIDIFHDSFRKADRSKSRILAIWDQSASGPGAPAGFNYGVEYKQAAIEAALAVDVANPGTASFPHVDGKTVGGKFVETGGHGTHVASIAAGDGSADDTCDGPGTFVGVAPEADIIVVSYVFDDTFIRDATQYIFNSATALNQPGRIKPVVVNMSFGWNLGPHDGTYQLEADLDALLSPGGVPLPGRAIVKSAGNEGTTRRHARKPIAANGTAHFEFEILAFADTPRDTSPDRLDVWFDAAATLALSIDGPPTGGTDSHAFIAAGELFQVSGTNVTVSSAVVESNGQKHIRIDLSASQATPVTKGSWKLHFTESAGGAAIIDIWVGREDSDVYPRFIEADAVRENTINTPGNSRSVITVGSYDPDRFLGLGFLDFHLDGSSGWGLPIEALPAGRRLKPDIAAPGDQIMAAASGESRKTPACSHCCNYLHVDMSGTSMATPHVAGAVALLFEKDRNLTFEQVRAFLQVTASRDSLPGSEVPPVLPIANGGGGIGTPGQPGFLEIHQNHKWGSGRLDVKRAVEVLQALSGGGGGGGGGIDTAEPMRPQASASRGFPTWPQELIERPAFQLIAALISTHVDEVRRLIESNKRVAVVWRRGGGPALLRYLAERPREGRALLPAQVEDYPLQALIARLMKVFARFGGETLRADVARWGELLLTAPGSDIDALDRRLREIAS